MLLSGEGPEHRCVAATLQSALGDRLVAAIVARVPHQSLLHRWRRYRRKYTLPQLWSRALARAAQVALGAARRRRHAAEATLPEGALEALPSSIPLHVVRSHNSPESLALLHGLHPDVVCVYGTGVIGQKIITDFPTVLNLHTGISPRYRGSDTVFWALHNQEPEWIGATVHRLVSALDAGPILATVRTPVRCDDDEHTLFFRTVAVGAQLYAETVARWLAGDVSENPQDLAQGREYRFVDRTMAAELRVRRLLGDGLLSRFPAG